jgi:hypothetical protein
MPYNIWIPLAAPRLMKVTVNNDEATGGSPMITLK